MTMTARIESDGPYARLDEQGKYQLRTLFDLSSSQHTQATTPMRRISPYGGLPNESNVGFHTPLHDGDEVLISCLNGDPDRPMIVGTVPNPERVSPVTSANPSVNRLRTLSDNELTFDDTKQKEAITLRTYEGYNILHMDAAAVGHKVRLATEHGAMVTFAKKTIHRQSDDTMTERVGNDRLVKVKNMHRTETQTKEIHHQAKTDHEHAAHKNMRTESGKNTELQTGRHMVIDVEDNVNITIKGSGGLFATVKNNDVFIQSANKIDIKGQGGGDITFEQSGGGFKIDAGGVVSFYGKKVFFGGSGGVQLNGKVNYSVPGPNPPGPVSTAAPIGFAGINALIDPADPEIIHLVWSEKRFTPGETVQQMFTVKKAKPGETATITIYECDADDSKQQIDQQMVVLDSGEGHYVFDWVRSAKDAEADLEKDEQVDDDGPLIYRFVVELNGVTSDDSPPLLMPTTYEIQLSANLGEVSSLYSREPYLIKKEGGVIRAAETDATGTILLRCADPTANYSVCVLGQEYMLDMTDFSDPADAQGQQERLGLLGYDGLIETDISDKHAQILAANLYRSEQDLPTEKYSLDPNISSSIDKKIK
ncbi:hypothetical protein MNBD_GAMMA21-1367 [hydrothermal vent metagenome]|uniref:VgrG protein n=1 Tax=hydrothermal vent metagenome TaxID=652676 RepID=A0A3B1AW41_9ZZZZ